MKSRYTEIVKYIKSFSSSAIPFWVNLISFWIIMSLLISFSIGLHHHLSTEHRMQEILGFASVQTTQLHYMVHLPIMWAFRANASVRAQSGKSNSMQSHAMLKHHTSWACKRSEHEGLLSVHNLFSLDMSVIAVTVFCDWFWWHSSSRLKCFDEAFLIPFCTSIDSDDCPADSEVYS